MVAADLLSRARAGDGEAFGELAGRHRRELQVHCYRMLGSFADAEDAVQETMLAAWQGIGGFAEDRASLRTWLYTIATRRCLNARRAAARRPAAEWDMSQFEAPVPTPRAEPVWLQPFPDALLEGADAAPVRRRHLHPPRPAADKPPPASEPDQSRLSWPQAAPSAVA
jgi:RNA polymerase sigma-70 factor (ECF subfamily)